VDDIKIKRIGSRGHVIRIDDERCQEKTFLMRNFIIKDQWENQE
jgi:hypothetical protein